MFSQQPHFSAHYHLIYLESKRIHNFVNCKNKLLKRIHECIFITYIVAYARTPKKFIVGGADVDPIGKWPWQASLQIGTSHNCGAVLIENPDGSDNHIYALTAAHCVESAPCVH